MVPSEVVLAAALAVYPLSRHLLAGSQPPLERLVAINKATSTVHSTVSTILSASFLAQSSSQPWKAHAQTSLEAEQDSARQVSRYPDDSSNPAIQIRSSLGNIITALECGYLIQDTFALIWEARLRSSRVGTKSGKLTLETILKFADKTLLTHHVGLGIALLILQHYIHHNRERGIYIIVQLILMNSSTPILNLRWWLRTHLPRSRLLCLASDVAFAAAFYLARIRLVENVLGDYGLAHGRDSAWKTYWQDLRLPCQLGTGALYVANAAWWASFVSSLPHRVVSDFKSRRLS